MRCYYEILDVARDAEDGEIKTAYRKLALKWHPDKNLHNEELATEQFQLVQQAYEVLSDRQERAWYDNHREQILRGSDSNFEDNSLDVFPYFTTQCFKGYGDDAKGFYTIYRKVFEQIAKEDIEYMDSKSEFEDIPVFGKSTSEYEDVVGPFYAYWMGYSTRRTYVWLDPYNIKETRERRVLKLIEKENKKVRLKAKKERNEEIRNLVAFVRKRDKRVLAYSKQLEIKNAENRLKQEEIRKQKILERKKELNTDTQAEWSKFDNVQRELQEIEKNLAAQFGEDLSESDEELSVEECDDLYCVACNKVFKNPKAFANHESSKKHKENVEKLKIYMKEEDEENDDEEDISDIEELEDIENGDLDINVELDETNKKKEERQSQEEINNIKNLENDDDEEINIVPKKRNKKNKKVIRIHNNSVSENNLEHSNNEEAKQDDFDFGSSKKQKKKNKNKPQVETSTKTNDIVKLTETEDGTPETNEATKQTKKQTNTKNKPNKKQQIPTTPINLEDIDTSHVCVTCKSIFNSKNKLFDHLKKTGHSVLINPQQKPPKSKKKAK